MNFANIRNERFGRGDALQVSQRSFTIADETGYHPVRSRDRPFSALALRTTLFAPLLAESCFVFDTSF
jgi:hypothetical protein